MSGPTVFVSAGEPSGDAHAAGLVRALVAEVPGVRVEGVGGAEMEAAGVALLRRIESLTVMGFVEVVRKIPAHLGLLRAVRARLARGDVRLVVLVDYPGFHLRVARAARLAGVRVLYYVAPAAWAWNEGRVRRLRRDVSRLAVILPFEEAFFRDRGVAATFVGNPLLDRIPGPAEDRGAAKRALGLDPRRPVLAVFPGSRAQEVARLWPVLREAARLVAEALPDLQVVVATRPGLRYPDEGTAVLVEGRSEACLAAADAALLKSGTTTLEAALLGTPHVVAYRVHPVSYLLARLVARVRWISLVNLVAGREVTPEFVQGRASAELLAGAVRPLLDPASPARAAQVEGLREVRARLGGPGAAGRAAGIARELLGP